MGDDGTTRARRGTLSGQHIAGHEIVRVLAAGGMGEVYLARHLGLDMMRAIKVIKDNLRDEGDAQARFAREAQVLARLQHNSIVQIIDYGTLPNGWPYLAMEYIDGPDLGAVIEASGPMELVRSLGVLEQIASALMYAHKKGVVHRDLKPSNVLLRSGDIRQVKVIDFGLAHTHRSGEMRLTAEGQMMGSPLYMAPEQADGNLNVTAAADVYALAGVAYSLISGRPPFHGMSLLQLISAQADEIPQHLIERCPQLNLPPFLDHLLFACLAKDPTARPQIDELVGHLARLARNAEPGGQSAIAAAPVRSAPPPPALGVAAPVPVVRAPEVGSESLIARLLDHPPVDDGSGVAPALVNLVFAIVGDLAASLSSSDAHLSQLHADTQGVRAELEDVEMEIALSEAQLDAAPPAQRAAVTIELRLHQDRARTLNERVSTLLRQMIVRVEQKREQADAVSKPLFAEVDEVLVQLNSLSRSR